MAWEARRVEELLEATVMLLKQQGQLLQRVAGYEAAVVTLLKQLVESQSAPTYSPTANITVKVTP
jgi:hypothetical protein